MLICSGCYTTYDEEIFSKECPHTAKSDLLKRVEKLENQLVNLYEWFALSEEERRNKPLKLGEEDNVE